MWRWIWLMSNKTRLRLLGRRASGGGRVDSLSAFTSRLRLASSSVTDVRTGYRKIEVWMFCVNIIRSRTLIYIVHVLAYIWGTSASVMYVYKCYPSVAASSIRLTNSCCRMLGYSFKNLGLLLFFVHWKSKRSHNSEEKLAQNSKQADEGQDSRCCRILT
jgi:hypothetical protein